LTLGQSDVCSAQSNPAAQTGYLLADVMGAGSMVLIALLVINKPILPGLPIISVAVLGIVAVLVQLLFIDPVVLPWVSDTWRVPHTNPLARAPQAQQPNGRAPADSKHRRWPAGSTSRSTELWSTRRRAQGPIFRTAFPATHPLPGSVRTGQGHHHTHRGPRERVQHQPLMRTSPSSQEEGACPWPRRGLCSDGASR